MNEQIEQEIKQIKKSLCKIKISDDRIGTGFFCRINIPNVNSIENILITTSQVLGQNDIIPGKQINLTLYDGQKLDIDINPSYKTYTDINFDTTIIQIKNKNIIPLAIDKQAFDKKIDDIYKNKSVYLFDFSDKNKKIYSVGLIQKIDQNYNIESLCFNKRSSLGGPIVNSSTKELIGIHRGSKGGLNWKYGTFIRGPIEAFINKNYSNNIQQANQNMFSYQNKNQFMNKSQPNQIMNNINYINQNNYINNLNNMNYMSQNQYMHYSNMNYMQNNIGYNSMNMNLNNNYVGMNQNNQFQNNNNIYPNQNNNLNNQFNNENDMNYQNQINQINQNIPSEKKEQKDIYEDLYPNIGGDKINITFKLFEHTEKKVKIPTIFHNSELYYTADKIKNPYLFQFTDLKKIILFLNNKEIKNDNSLIGLKNEDVIVIKDNPAYSIKSINIKNNKKKLNIFFKYGLNEICKFFIPAELTFDKMCMEFFIKNNIKESNKNKFLFKFEGNYIDSNRIDKLINYKLRNNSTIEINIKNEEKKYPGKEIKAKIIDEKNKLILNNFKAGTLQKINDFYEELKEIYGNKNLPYLEKIVIKQNMNEVEFKINNRKLNDERAFISFGISNDFTCKVFQSRNLMFNQKNNNN